MRANEACQSLIASRNDQVFHAASKIRPCTFESYLPEADKLNKSAKITAANSLQLPAILFHKNKPKNTRELFIFCFTKYGREADNPAP